MNQFQQNILNIHKEKGKIWLDDLSNIVSLFAQKWNLIDPIPVDNLSYNYVLYATQDLKPVILKLSLDPEDLKREAEALQAFSGYGGIDIIDYQPNALLMIRATPGHSLSVKRDEALKIACEIAKKLHQAPIPKNNSFLTIESRFAYLDQNWNIPIDHLKRARELKQQISAMSGQRVLLHGDLHHDNILANGNDWLVIDPKGVIGYPINEVWAFVMVIEKDLAFIAEYFNFELSDVVKCYYVHVVLSACWAVEDNGDPSFFLRLADRVLTILMRIAF